MGKDILLQCKEVFAQHPQAYADAKTSPEMAQERYERVTSTFMMAVSYLSGIFIYSYCYFCFVVLPLREFIHIAETLSPEDNAAFAEQYKAIFLDHVFWKFLTNKSTTIRRATYLYFVFLFFFFFFLLHNISFCLFVLFLLYDDDFD